MDKDKKTEEGTTSADDNVNNNVRYSDSGEVIRDDERDRTDSTSDWNAEDSRTGRHK